MKLRFSIVLFFAFCFNLSAQDNIVKDSVAPKFTDSRLYQMSKAPVSFFVLSGLGYPFERYIYDVRNYHIPNFRYHYDDYLQYTPGMAVLGLKLAGVEGYSDWGRFLTSTFASTVTTASLVGGLKYAVGKQRPDKAGNNSFPSGHTATAFLTATWLHKEYGLTRSPLYSVAGYTAATLTGLSRQLNNKHWFSDVLFGAGVGYLSAEIGYWVGDLIFKEKGIKTPYVKREYVDLKENNPSFISLNMGYVISSGIDLGGDVESENAEGYNIAVEGAWFINPYLGFGGKLSSNTVSITDNDFAGIYSFNAGACFALPIVDRFTLGSKLLGGVTCSSLSFETGISATFLLSRNLGVRAFTDYLLCENHNLIIGLSATAYLF